MYLRWYSCVGNLQHFAACIAVANAYDPVQVARWRCALPQHHIVCQLKLAQLQAQVSDHRKASASIDISKVVDTAVQQIEQQLAERRKYLAGWTQRVDAIKERIKRVVIESRMTTGWQLWRMLSSVFGNCFVGVKVTIRHRLMDPKMLELLQA